MHKLLAIARPERRVPTLRRTVRVLPRPAARSDVASRKQQVPSEPSAASPPANFQIDPYLDYGRFLTAEGGILIIYKDIDLRLRHTIWRLLAWTIFTGLEAAYLFYYSPLQNQWLQITALLGAAVINWLIVAKPVELYHKIEIRPDCMMIEDQEIFWLRFMENWPTFRPDKKGHQILGGIYGTRFVEFLTARRFDEYDRTPAVFAAHLQDAMKQLWTGLQ